MMMRVWLKRFVSIEIVSRYVVGPSWSMSFSGLKGREKGASIEFFLLGLLTLALQE